MDWLIFFQPKLKLKKKNISLVYYSLSLPCSGTRLERNFAIASNSPEVHLHNWSFDIKSQYFFCPPCSWWSRFSLVHSFHCHPFLPHKSSAKIVCCRQLCHTQGRQPGLNPGARRARSCFVFHVKYCWRMTLKEWLKKPYAASSEDWTLLSCQRISIWHRAGCHVGFSQACFIKH